ncbi:MAG: hypothetical protein QOI36_4663 [Pseudonocardiales bacterium]|jgi:hypothetical protein|nr:hypothetical protein [Pseudonocardiales bacterium]
MISPIMRPCGTRPRCDLATIPSQLGTSALAGCVLIVG